MIKNHTHNNDSGCTSSIYVLENNRFSIYFGPLLTDNVSAKVCHALN